jgi:hypothetical protein
MVTKTKSLILHVDGALFLGHLIIANKGDAFMKCLIKHNGEIREKKENEEVFVDNKKIEAPIGIDMDLGAVRYVVINIAVVIYGKVEVREKKKEQVSKEESSSKTKDQLEANKGTAKKQKTS